MATESTNTSLGIPRSVATRTYLVIARAILAHPHVKRLAKSYNVFGVAGLPNNLAGKTLAPDWVPVAGQAPSLWLWPEARDGQPGTNASQSATLNVAVRWYVLGPDPLDAMDFWGLIEESVSPRSVAGASDFAAALRDVSKWGTPLLYQPGSVSLETDAGIVTVLDGAVSMGYRIQGFMA